MWWKNLNLFGYLNLCSILYSKHKINDIRRFIVVNSVKHESLNEIDVSNERYPFHNVPGGKGQPVLTVLSIKFSFFRQHNLRQYYFSLNAVSTKQCNWFLQKLLMLIY
uniref:Uncharacterized protein n=1 Tax=Pararge aegeria TaxID=116150 RepID=S4NK95_9NEOP